MLSNINKDFRLTDADLGLFATNLTIPMTRDATEFAAKVAVSFFDTASCFFIFIKCNNL